MVKRLKQFILFVVTFFIVIVCNRYLYERWRFYDFNGSYRISDCTNEYLVDYAQRYFSNDSLLDEFFRCNGTHDVAFRNVPVMRHNIKTLGSLMLCDETGMVKGYVVSLFSYNRWRGDNGFLKYDFTKPRCLTWLSPGSKGFRNIPFFLVFCNDGEKYCELKCFDGSVLKEGSFVLVEDDYGSYRIEPITFMTGSYSFK